MNRIFTFCILGFFSIALHSQDNVKKHFQAIAIDKSQVSGHIFETISDQFEGSVINNHTYGSTLYDWNDESSSVVYSNKNKVAERPVDQVIFMKAGGKFSTQPQLKTQFDTLGNITRMYFELEENYFFQTYLIDVATGIQQKSRKTDLIPYRKFQLLINNFRDYFNGKVEIAVKEKNDDYFEAEEKIKSIYYPLIPNKYLRKKDIQEKIDYFFNAEFSIDKNAYQTTQLLDSEGEYDGVLINAGKDTKIEKGDWIYFYEKNQLNEQYHYYQYIGVGTAKEVRESETVVRNIVPGKKRIKALFSENKPVTGVHKNNLDYLKTLNIIPGLEKINVKIESGSSKKDVLFTSIEKCAAFNLITRDFPELKYFDNLFVSGSSDDFKNLEKVGFEILIKDVHTHFHVISIKTGEVILSIPRRDYTLGALSEVNSRELINFGDGLSPKSLSNILYSIDPVTYKTVWIDNVKYSDNSISSIKFFNPGGFEHIMYFEIFQTDEEIVDGVAHDIDSFVARGMVRGEYSSTIGLLDIDKGKKELYKLYASGKKYKIIPK